MREFRGTVRVRGYSSSPIAWRDTVILQVGGTGSALMAFDQKDGAVRWKRHDFENSPSSPLLVRVDGQDQLVAFLAGEIVGVDPDNGDLLWQHPHQTDYGLNISMPVWGEDNLLFCTSAYGGGSRVLKLTREGGKTSVAEQWFHRLMRIHFGNAIRVGDNVYGSSGDSGPTPFTALNVRTGKLLWRDRSFARASILYADGRFVILDEDGNLALATTTATGVEVHARAAVLESNAWTVPTLVGTTLYARDRKRIIALDLGEHAR